MREFFSMSEVDATGVDYEVTTAGTHVAWTGGTVRSKSAGITVASGVVTIARGGFYRFTFGGRVRGENSAVVQVSLALAGTEIAATLCTTTMAASALAAGGAVYWSGILPVADSGAYSVRFDSDTNGDDVAVHEMSLVVEEVGGF
jgi:hypothetical protein